MKPLDVLLASLIPATILFHLLAAPYTKVEESFTIQATHDILVYGTPTRNINARFHAVYDHFTFPGAVPRSFVGPVMLAGISQPIVAIFGFQHAQMIVRGVLGMYNAAALLYYAHSVKRGLGKSAARWWTVMTASQFHIMFYASRTLPNMFAFGLTTISSALLLPHPDQARKASRIRISISLLVFAAVIFRSEVALLLFTTAATLLATRQTTLGALLPGFIVSSLAALVLSAPLDSYFWQTPLWPELWAFAFNVLRGGASDWGTSPWHYYVTSALPRLLLNPTAPFLIASAAIHPATARTARLLVAPSLAFVAIYSLQPHKEARFVFYAVPPLTAAVVNAAAAQAAALTTARAAKSPLARLATAATTVAVFASAAAAAALLALSSLNYPGGEALSHVARVAALAPAVATPAAANPAGRPVLLVPDGAGLRFDKTEDAARLKRPGFWLGFDYLLVEDPAVVAGGRWETLGVVEGGRVVAAVRDARDKVGAVVVGT
ncbi:Dol-P-Man:Man(7)GlcNAc(2)-PP-Dol alpha-1 like protein [Verticillium longisporum]|uniref:Mannosyltransferase n=1 Tax=Verticillium longisporum TaxID=100787 RepID=A0A8I2ZU21_VERLO|nr:Dol-P-Man:Man(7)GlcNAc(2)-PP-Dol alpha-1 like protein [Verticillium longisporum]